MTRRYLIVDDNEEFAENLAEILVDSGSTATVAAGGERAIELCAATRFDAMVCDMRMPLMSGAEVVRRVRSVDPGLPAIVATAYTRDDDLAAARAQGLLAVFPKPIPLPRVQALLQVARRDALVAIVEDDPSIADNLAELLREHGFAAVMAHSVDEARRLAGARPFVAVVDLRVPGGPDGQAMADVAALFPGVPIVVLSGHTELAAPTTHATRFDKPFDSAALIRAMKEIHAGRNRS